MTLTRNANGSARRNAGELQAAGERAELATALTEVTDTEESMRRVLVAAREHLDMDLSYFSRLVGNAEVISGVYGDAHSFGLEAGTRIAFADAYCQAVIDGRLPNLITHVRRDGRATELVPKSGSYVGVPLSFSDGRADGMLCCVSHAPAPWLRERDVAFLRVLGRMLAHQLERSEVERAEQNHRNEAIALAALFAGLDARDSYTGRHSEAVVELAARVTRALGMPQDFVAEVKQVALLHDVGKIGIPDAILGKPGPLDEAEWELMHEHPIIGAGIVASIEPLAHLAPAVRAEHERCDGKGYPDGLSGEQIPLASRITLACDAHHAMLSSRPYRAAMRPSAAVAELRENAGTQFDPDVVDALLSIVAQ
jgi:hypothetical protein